MRLRHLQARPELNGQCGTIGALDEESGRYSVTLDSSESVRVKPVNISPQQGWATGTDAMVGLLHAAGRALDAFSKTSLTSAQLIYCEDHSHQLDSLATGGALHAWLCYGEGNGNLRTYGAGDGAWRIALRAFQTKPRRPSFTFAFMLLCAVDCNVDASVRLKHALTANPTLVMEELAFLHRQAKAGVREISKVKEFNRSEFKRLMASFEGQCEAVEELLEPVMLTTVQSCPWLAGEVLYVGGQQASTLTSNVMWVQHVHLTVLVHTYHALRYRGHLRAIPEVDAFTRVFRRSCFFRLEQLPTKGGFRKALTLTLGQSVAGPGQPDHVRQTIMDHTGQGISEISLLHYVAQFAGAGLDLMSLDFQAIAREEVGVLHRAPHLVGVAKLCAVEDRLMCPHEILREADADGAEWPRLAKHAVECFEQLFPGCALSPPDTEAAVPLCFSSYKHVAPIQGQVGAHASSYTPTSERKTSAEMKATMRESAAHYNAVRKGRK